MKPVEGFLADLATSWSFDSRPHPRIIGSTALMLQTDYVRGTKDSDVLQTTDLDDQTRERLLALGGKDSALAQRWRLYLEVVPNGLPFLPRPPRWHAVAVPTAPDTLAFEALDVVDVVVSKLKRFHANDRLDVDAMVKRELVSHRELVARFLTAVDGWSCDARAEDLPRCVRNLHQVERDMLDVEPTEIDLPDWI